jgi:hypothetical protein
MTEPRRWAGQLVAAWRHHRHPVSRLLRLEAQQARVARLYHQVGLVVFMPRSRQRFRQKLWVLWGRIGRQHAMLSKAIHADPGLRAELYRRREAAIRADPQAAIREALAQPPVLPRRLAAPEAGREVIIRDPEPHPVIDWIEPATERTEGKVAPSSREPCSMPRPALATPELATVRTVLSPADIRMPCFNAVRDRFRDGR